MDTIPEELLLHIIKWIPHNFLPVLALTCQRIHKCVVPELYRFVEIRDKKRPQKFLYGLPPALSPARNFEYRTQTSNWQHFTRTIEQSAFLRSFIRGVAYEPKYTLDCFHVAKILEPQLQYMHLTCALFQIRDLVHVPFVSVHMSYQSMVQRNMIGLYVDPVRDLESAFNIPNLRNISISHFDFDNFDAPRSVGHPTGFSAVSSLSFQQACLTSTAIENLAALVSWSKSLHVFQMSIAGPSNDRRWIRIKPASTEAVITTLVPHAAKLKELFIRRAFPPNHTVDTVPKLPIPAPNLQQFSNITVLGLSEDDLCVDSSEFQDTAENDNKAEPQVPKWQMLPPNLEKLQIEVTELHWNMGFYDGSWISSDGAIRFGDWLKALVPHKTHCCPVLWNCVVWDWRKAGEDINDLSYRSWLESLGVVAEFERAGIRLDATTDCIPPLLSLGLKDQD